MSIMHGIWRTLHSIHTTHQFDLSNRPSGDGATAYYIVSVIFLFLLSTLVIRQTIGLISSWGSLVTEDIEPSKYTDNYQIDTRLTAYKCKYEVKCTTVSSSRSRPHGVTE